MSYDPFYPAAEITEIHRLEAKNERLRGAPRAAGLSPSTVNAIAKGEPPRPCPAGHVDQCCGYFSACDAATSDGAS